MTVGSARTLKRRRLRHARRAKFAAAEAERLRWERLPPHLKVIEAREAARSWQATCARLNAIVAERITPSIVDDYFRGSSFVSYLRRRGPIRWDGPREQP